MDVREKLVEIAEKASARTLPKNTCHTNIVMLVNALIEEGVTVQEWISVKDRLPEQPPNIVDEKGRTWFTPDIDCIVYDGKSVFAAHYCFQNKFFWYADTMHPLKNITHWMEMPQSPKGGAEMSGWISVKDRLPEDECRCLVFDAAGDIEMDVYDGEGTFRLERCGAMQHPSYWMPLPKPPEEDKPMTNADHIRSMGDDDLAAFLCNLRSEEASGNACSKCVAEEFCHYGHTGMIDWLRQPVEDTECT